MTGTNLSLFAGGKIALRDPKLIAAAVANAAQSGRGGGSDDLPPDGVYISFSGKQGRYSVGEDKEDMDKQELWLVNVMSLEAGWICWKGGEPVAKRMASIFGEPVETPDMNEHGPFRPGSGDGWQEQKAFMVKSADTGIQGYFSSSSKSGRRVMASLEKEIAARMGDGRPCWPIVQFDKEQFKAQGQTNWKPVIEAFGWIAMQQVQKLAGMSAEEVAANIEAMIEEADLMVQNGVTDSTLTGGEDDEPTDDYEADAAEDDGIEEAEIAEDDGAEYEEGDDGAEYEEGDEGDEEEPEVAEEPKATSRAAAARRARPTEEKAAEPARTGGLSRRVRGRV